MPEVVLFKTEDLLPDEWHHFSADGPVRTFNPGLLRSANGWIFAYRVVGPDGHRRIGMCRLDDRLRVVAGSPAPFSDRVTFAASREHTGPALVWFADPRLYRLDGRIFVYWNSGWHEPRNFQFVQELDETTFEPIGHPRELVLRGSRQPLEKNWTLFCHGNSYAVYSASPHRVLSFSLTGDADIEFTDVATHPWDLSEYESVHGRLRGGSPPQLWDGHYWSFCHSVAGIEGSYRYVAAVYRFAINTPFAPTDMPTRELELGNPIGAQRRFSKLNPAVGEVVYPCGAARHGDRWLLSYGINDEHCAIAQLTDSEVAGALRPLGTGR